MRNTLLLGAAAIAGLVNGAAASAAWNNPYPHGDRHANTLYTAFDERPKHLDPARSYSSDEYDFIGQIYEPPLQYHYLKRPYQLIPLTATRLPEPVYYDTEGQRIDRQSTAVEIAYSVYRIDIKPGIEYAPHPALARNEAGEYLYHTLALADLAGKFTLDDFPRSGSRELTAADYVNQIKRLAHPAVHSPIGGLMAEYIEGLAELRAILAEAYEGAGGAGAYLDLRKFELSGVRVLDRYSYEIRVKGKYPQFVYWLAMPFFAPMPWEAERFYSQQGMDERNITLDWYPVGTGPFVLTENNPNLRMTLERNPNFHGEAYPDAGSPGDAADGYLQHAGKALPLLERAVFSRERESIPYWNKFLQGYFDASGISSDSFDQAVEFSAGGEAQLTDIMREKGIRLVTATEPSVSYMGFNMLDDVVGGDTQRARKLRQAISIIIDYEEFISIFLNGRGEPAQGPLPPGIFGHLPGEAGVNAYTYRWDKGKARRRPVSDAKTLLVEAGYPDGIDQHTGTPLILNFDTALTGPAAKSIFDWLRKQFKKLDIQLVIRSTDYNRFRDKMERGTAQIFMWGWNADYPDPENFLFLLHGPNSMAGHHGENSANYQNADYDKLFEQMKNLENGPERQRIIDDMLEIARRDAPWLFGYHPVSFGLQHSWYDLAKPVSMGSKNALKYKNIDPVKRAELREQWNRPVVMPVLVVILVLVVSGIPAWNTIKRRSKATIDAQ